MQPSFWSRKQLWFLIGTLAVLLVAWPAAANAAGSSFADMQAEIEAQAGSMTANMAPAASTLQSAAGGVPAPPVDPAPPAAAPTPPAPPQEPPPAPTTGGVAAPTDAAPTPSADPPEQSNTNVTIRVLSPGNDGPVIQQNVAIGTGGDAAPAPTPPADPPASSPAPGAPDVWNWTWDCGGSSAPPPAAAAQSSGTVWNWNWTGDCQAAVQQLQDLSDDLQQMPSTPSTSPAPPPAPQQVAAPTHRRHRHVARAAPKPAAVPAVRATPFVNTQAVTSQPVVHVRQARSDKSRQANRPAPELPSQLPLPEDQNLGAGPPGGTSTPPPAPLAVLLAAACFGASTLVWLLRDAHWRRRSRLFASRLERPG